VRISTRKLLKAPRRSTDWTRSDDDEIRAAMEAAG
jgi:hypothetical protein